MSSAVSKIPKLFRRRSTPSSSKKKKGGKKEEHVQDLNDSPGLSLDTSSPSGSPRSPRHRLSFTPTLSFDSLGSDAESPTLQSPTAEALLKKAGMFGSQLLEKLRSSEREVEALMNRNRKLRGQVSLMEKTNLELETNLITIESKQEMQERRESSAQKYRLARHPMSLRASQEVPLTSPLSSPQRQLSAEFSPAVNVIDSGSFIERFSSELRKNGVSEKEKEELMEVAAAEKKRADELTAKFAQLEEEKIKMEADLEAARAHNATLEANLKEHQNLLHESEERVSLLSLTSPRSSVHSEDGGSFVVADIGSNKSDEQAASSSSPPDHDRSPSKMSDAIKDAWYTETFREELQLIESSSSHLFDDSTPPKRIEKQSSIRARIARAESSHLRKLFRESGERHGHYEVVNEEPRGFLAWAMCCGGGRR